MYMQVCIAIRTCMCTNIICVCAYVHVCMVWCYIMGGEEKRGERRIRVLRGGV